MLRNYGTKRILQNTHAQPFSRDRCLIFGRTQRLLPYFMCANSEGSGETARLSLRCRLCERYHNLMGWLIYMQLIQTAPTEPATFPDLKFV